MTNRDADMLDWLSVVRVAEIDAMRPGSRGGLREAVCR